MLVTLFCFSIIEPTTHTEIATKKPTEKVEEIKVTNTPTPTLMPTERPMLTPTPIVTPKPKPTEKPIRKISSKEYELLARLVHAEASSEGMEARIGVANVVLNRVKSKEFPDSITEVIYEPRQFSVVANGTIKDNPDPESYEAVDRALSGENTVSDCVFFWAEWLDKDATYLWSKPIWYKYDETVFAGETK